MQKEHMSRVYGKSFIVNGMMDDAIFTSFLTVFQLYQDAVRVIMKGCAQRTLFTRRGWNPGMLDQ